MTYEKSKGFASEEQYDAVIEVLESRTDENLCVFDDCFDSIYINYGENGELTGISLKLGDRMDFLELSYDDGPVLTLSSMRNCTTASIAGMSLEAVSLLSAPYYDVLDEVKEALVS